MAFEVDQPTAVRRARVPEPPARRERRRDEAASVLALQRAAGNRATAALLSRQPAGVAVAEPVALPEPVAVSRVKSPPGPTIGLPELEPEKVDKRARELAHAYWERLMDYHQRWGHWPWERGSQPKRSEYAYEVDPKQAAEDQREYQRARAILRREAELPKTPELKEIFLGGAARAGQLPWWYEQLLTDPVNSLETIKQETPQQLSELVAQSGSGIQLTPEQIETMSTEALLKVLLQARVITQSCGQTAGLLHEVLSPSTAESTPVKQDVENIRAAIRRANELAASEQRHRYVRIEGGGHSFIVEVADGRCRIYQSFWGTMTFAYDLAREASFPLARFLELLSLALVPNEVKDKVAPAIETARRTLFNSAAVHPPARLSVTEFGQEPGAAQRLDQKFTAMAPQWAQPLSQPAKDFTARPAPPQPSTPLLPKPTGTRTISLDDRDWTFVDASTYATTPGRGLQAGAEYYVQYKGHSLSVKVTGVDLQAGTAVLEIDPS